MPAFLGAAHPLAADFAHPPREFTLIPFWFWNDDLDASEIVRQIADFDARGVHGFVIHPRVGLPRSIGWMSDRMLDFVEIAVGEAARRDMRVVLYDEGMYPSGSSSGQVVAENPAFACRGLVCETEAPEPGAVVVGSATLSDGRRVSFIDRPIDSVIRGIHALEDGSSEDEPPAGDLLNPDSVRCFIRLVYDRYFERLGRYFGTTIIGMFTDEPMLLGRCRERRPIAPWTGGLLEWIGRRVGYDFAPHLAALFDDGAPDAAEHRRAFETAVHERLAETLYRPLSQWCEAHGVALMGHPAEPDSIDFERFFHIPGQDIVWRWVEPGKPSGIEGPQSTQAKCTSSAMIHAGRRRNSNECYGAFGHDFTYEEMVAIANWLFVRGVNMLIPHAFYYSVRGFRRDERPPDVGPNSAWWSDYRTFAEFVARMSWLNTDSVHRCGVAILSAGDRLPWRAAGVCLESQRDFNYLEVADLSDRGRVVPNGEIEIAGMNYRAAIVDGDLGNLDGVARAALAKLSAAGRLIEFDPASSGDLIAALDRLVPPRPRLAGGGSALRVRQVAKGETEFAILSNESAEPIVVSLEPGHGFDAIQEWDPMTGRIRPLGDAVRLEAFASTVLAFA